MRLLTIFTTATTFVVTGSSTEMGARFLTRFGFTAVLILCLMLIISCLLRVLYLESRLDLLLESYLEQQPSRDWHVYEQSLQDLVREGPGEHGAAVYMKLKAEQRENFQNLLDLHGFNALLSDYISVNRSLPDLRPKACSAQLYLAKLPSASIVIIFHNEHLSVLLRSIHSLVNRSPAELLHEIILVDDASNLADLQGPLEAYLQANFASTLIKLLRLGSRSGLIKARLRGAREAKAPVLVFLDSHIEASYNWLPPLLEPIARHNTTAICPIIDVIDHEDFSYTAQDEGGRGVFDWRMDYKRLPQLREPWADGTEPYAQPVMAGGLFAISRQFFWHLGGYDADLDIWGGEQYELSFKIWMCGGSLLEAPCSRVGHIYRNDKVRNNTARSYDFLHRNLKRVAEVWMDEYKQYVYMNAEKGLYEQIDAGDLSSQQELRAKLHCKSFDWYMQNVASDIMKHYPPIWPASYASGALQTLANYELCLYAEHHPFKDNIGLKACPEQLEAPPQDQHFELSAFNDLRFYRQQYCLEPVTHEPNVPLMFFDCHQLDRIPWYYNREQRWLQSGENGELCLEALPAQRKVRVSKCAVVNLNMRWQFGLINETALNLLDAQLS